MKRATIAAVVTVGAALLAAPLAVAAPTEGVTNESTVRFQNEGSPMVSNGATSGTACVVTPLQLVQVGEPSRGGASLTPLSPLARVGAVC